MFSVIMPVYNGEKFNMSFSEYPQSEEWHILKREEINDKIKEIK